MSITEYEAHVLNLLQTTLSASVPLRISEVREAGPYAWREALYANREEWANIIASKGDRLIFRAKKGESAKVFNAVTNALAHMAFFPGGVTAFDLHFEAHFKLHKVVFKRDGSIIFEHHEQCRKPKR